MRDWGYGPPPVNRNTGTDKARAADIWARRERGESYKDIAKIYGRSVERMRQIWIKEYNKRLRLGLISNAIPEGPIGQSSGPQAARPHIFPGTTQRH